ncbi:MAG TPA: hypothetical protein V6D11_02140 [Waterburya sp.]
MIAPLLTVAAKLPRACLKQRISHSKAKATTGLRSHPPIHLITEFINQRLPFSNSCNRRLLTAKTGALVRTRWSVGGDTI